MNAHVRDNLLETAVAKVTTAGDIVYATAANALARVAAGAITGGVANFKYVPKTADETVSSSVALQDDNHLLLALAASEIWTFELVLYVDGNASGDIKVAFTVPAGATGQYMLLAVDAANAVYGAYRSFGDGNAIDVGIAGGAEQALCAVIRGRVVNSTTPGNLQFRWAQQVSNATPTEVLKGSYMFCQKIA